MHTIWKFSLRIIDQQVVEMPANATLLSVGEQFGRVCLWARVDPDEPKIKRRGIVVVGSGHPTPGPDDPFTFIGTVITNGGALVWHIFDAGEQPEAG